MGFTLDLRYQICLQPIDLPVFNAVALELLQLLAEPEVEMSDVVGLINKDQALSLQILSLANSPAYAGRYRSDTIKDSVNRLGTRQIINLAMHASQAAIHSSSLPLVSDMLGKLWLHSYACATGCKKLAIRAGYHELAEHAYLAGLLHDIGKLYLLKAMEQISLNGEMDCELSHETLYDVFSDMHIEQGVRIMNHWNVPSLYVSIVANHHVDNPAIDDPLLAIVRLVNFYSNGYGLNSFPRFVQPDSVLPEIGLLNISEDMLEELEAGMKACIA
jgi:putative nucleotidyltransferase with HDIG domain